MGDIDKTKEQLINEINELRKEVNELRTEKLYNEEYYKKIINSTEESFRKLIKNTPVGVCITDEKGILESVNPAYCSIYGYSEKELLAKHFTIVVPEENKKQLSKLHDAFILKGTEPVGEYEVVDKNNRKLVVLVNAARIIGADGRHKKATFIIDITERKKNEEKIHHYAIELKRSNKELQDFASIASHDLQEPLRKIIAFGDRVKKSYSTVLDPRGIDYFTRMQNASKRMQSLIEDLLQYSRVTTKAKPFENINLNTVVEEVLADLEGLIERSGGQVIIEELPILDAEKHQMKQLFQNLIGNALKFHKQDIKPIVTIKSQKIKEKWQFTIQDNGIGFDNKYVDRILKPFQRLHGRNEFEGTGIGLAICHKIVTRHRGELNIESIPGQGSTFTVMLPANQ